MYFKTVDRNYNNLHIMNQNQFEIPFSYLLTSLRNLAELDLIGRNGSFYKRYRL